MLTILLVEDNPGDQKLFEDVLKELDLDSELILASSARESIDLIYSQKPDLIVMDVKMPGLSGEDFVRLLQDRATARFIPIIFITGNKELIAKYPMGISIDDKIYPILSKPPDPLLIRKVISKLIS